jgi:uncharacterized protein (TIGR01777 family)
MEQGNDIIAVTRSVDEVRKMLPEAVRLIGWENNELRAALGETDVVINLAGETIASPPWNKKKKTAILNSRMLAAQRLHQAISTISNKPAVFIQASAIGFYGHQPEKECLEATPSGDGFLAEVCRKWELHVPEMEQLIPRTITVRIGVVLGKYGGAFPELLKQSKRHLAGKLGSGEQWMSWIHIYDLVYAILFLINDPGANGVYNMVAPKPVRQKEFASILKNTSGSGMQLAAPAFMLKLILGEFGKEVLLNGQKVSASKLVRQGFMFRFMELGPAFDDLLDPYSH